MKITRRFAAVAGSAAAAVAVIAAGAGIAASSASAAPTTVTAATQVTNHPDTTAMAAGVTAGPACTSSPGGLVWANDNYTATFTAITAGTNTYRVTIDSTGTFKSFADPTTCNALATNGPFQMLYTVQVTSDSAPSPADLKASYDGSGASYTTMLQDLFDNQSAVVSGGAYFAVYQDGQYVQTVPSGSLGSNGSDIYGDVVPVEAFKLPALSTTTTASSLTASWAAVAGVPAHGFYDVEIINAHNGHMLFHGAVSGTTKTLSGLAASSHYAWRIAIIATDSFYTSTGWSAWQSVYTKS